MVPQVLQDQAVYHQQQEPIKARQHPLVLAAPPPADQRQLRPILLEHRVIPDPGPLPAALGGRTFVVDMTPEGLEDLQPQAPQPLEPGAVRQRPEQARGPRRVPTAHATQLGGRATAKKRGKHHPYHLAKELVLAP